MKHRLGIILATLAMASAGPAARAGVVIDYRSAEITPYDEDGQPVGSPLQLDVQASIVEGPVQQL